MSTARKSNFVLEDKAYLAYEPPTVPELVFVTKDDIIPEWLDEDYDDSHIKYPTEMDIYEAVTNGKNAVPLLGDAPSGRVMRQLFNMSGIRSRYLAKLLEVQLNQLEHTIYELPDSYPEFDQLPIFPSVQMTHFGHAGALRVALGLVVHALKKGNTK